MKNNSFIQVIIFSAFTIVTSCAGQPNKTASEWIKSTDARTGNEIWQLTSHDSISEAFYFYARSFTSDDKYAIFRSKRTGSWEVFRCDLTDGEIKQLTYEGVDNACIHPDGINMGYIAGWKYYKMNVHTMEKKMILDFTDKLPSPPGFRPTITNDGKYTLVVIREENLNILYRVNLESGEILKVLELNDGSFSHQLINPVDPNIITYCPLPDNQNDMGIPKLERPRTRIIRLDRGTNEPYLITPEGFRATHDSWSPLGNRFFFFEKKVPNWVPASIVSINLDGSDYTKHFTSGVIKLGHGAQSIDGEWFISDGQEPFDNPLVLLNLKDGKTEILCWPDASINTPARVHVHPNFSSSGNYVIYNTDVVKTDIHQVYVIPIKHIKDKW